MTERQYNTIVLNTSDILYRYCIMMVKNYPLAQDIVQESFISLWSNRQNVENDKAKNYLFRVCYNIIVSWRRKNDVKDKFRKEIETSNEENRYNGVKDAVNYYLEQLPTLQKDVLVLRDMQGYSYEEISQIVGCSLENVKVMVYRARKRMKELMISKENII